MYQVIKRDGQRVDFDLTRISNGRSTLTKEVEGALFAETIPYSETRDYVMRVTANTVQYSRYTNDPIHLTDLLGRIEPVPLSGNIIP